MSADAGLGKDLLWSPAFVARIPGADDAHDALGQAAAPLVAEGAVHPSFVDEVVATGLDSAAPQAFVGDGCAGALRLAAAVAIFKTPVPVAGAADVRIVAVVSRPEAGAGKAALGGLRMAIEDSELAEMLLDLPVEEAYELLCEAVDFYARHGDARDERAARTAPDSSRESRVRAVWRLLEAGDNFLKYSRSADRARADERARRKFEEALGQARSLDHERLTEAATARLRALGDQGPLTGTSGHD